MKRAATVFGIAVLISASGCESEREVAPSPEESAEREAAVTEPAEGEAQDTEVVAESPSVEREGEAATEGLVAEGE